jgi:hypothetical protein
MLIISSQPQEQADAYAAVVRAVEVGQLSRQQIDASLNRILKLKGVVTPKRKNCTLSGL